MGSQAKLQEQSHKDKLSKYQLKATYKDEDKVNIQFRRGKDAKDKAKDKVSNTKSEPKTKTKAKPKHKSQRHQGKVKDKTKRQDNIRQDGQRQTSALASTHTGAPYFH